MQGHNDNGRRLVHCAQRTTLATSHSLFAEWWRVSLVENVHLTKHTRTKCHPVCIHFVREQCGKDTEMSATGHYNGNDEGAITRLWLYEHACWKTMLWLEWRSTSVCCKVNFSDGVPLCLLNAWYIFIPSHILLFHRRKEHRFTVQQRNDLLEQDFKNISSIYCVLICVVTLASLTTLIKKHIFQSSLYTDI